MAAPKAPLLDAAGKAGKQVTLEAAVFGAEVKPHLVHEAVRAELNAARAGTRAAKSRGLVAGGRAKPWRQKGTGRARAGTIRAPQFIGRRRGVPAPAARLLGQGEPQGAQGRAALGALAPTPRRGTLAFVDGGAFDAPSTKQAVALLDAWGQQLPVVVVAGEDEEALIKSFRNLERVLVTVPAELEVAAIVWARSLLVTEAARELVERRASS